MFITNRVWAVGENGVGRSLNSEGRKRLLKTELVSHWLLGLFLPHTRHPLRHTPPQRGLVTLNKGENTFRAFMKLVQWSDLANRLLANNLFYFR